MKGKDFVTKIMESWITLYELEGAKTIRDYKSISVTKKRNLPTGRYLDYISSININSMNTTNGYTH